MKQTVSLFLFFLSFLFATAQKSIPNTTENDSLVKNFGLQLSKNLKQNNPDFFTQHILVNQLYDAIVFKTDKSPKIKRFNKQFKNLFKTRLNSFPKEICEAINHSDLYNFVSYHYDEIDKTYHLIFRYYTSQYGLDYHDYRIVTHQGKLFIHDVLVFSSNQKLSETLKLFYLSNIDKKDISSILKKSEYRNILILKNFVDAANQGDYKKAYQHISLLNKTLGKKDRFVLALVLDIASSVSEEAYIDTIDYIVSTYKNVASFQIIAYQYYMANYEYDEAYKSIITLQNYTHDSFLDFEKANLYFAKKDYETARIFYLKMLKNYPNFHLPKFSLLVVYDRTKQFEKAKHLLDMIVQTTSYSKASLAKQIQQKLPQFSNSKSFRKWLKN